MGTYDNQTVVDLPVFMLPYHRYSKVGIDNCILKEIKELWKLKVETIASCCGHNKVKGSIVVHSNSINRMIKLGYENWKDIYPDRPDIFLTKTQ